MSAIPPDVRDEILVRLRRAETEHDVRILLAVESGSRAWGFESPNSDFDVRFIYAHRPLWYFSVGLEEKRDVIEYEILDDIDLNGWDIRKALRLLRKSNPAFVEWLQSPIVYAESGSFATRTRALLPAVYSSLKGMHHYRSMASTNYRGYLKAESVLLKKYFYVLRPLLATRWIKKYGSAAPIEFARLLPLIEDDPALLSDIEALLAQKRATPELGRSCPVPRINAFIEQELEHLKQTTPPLQAQVETLPLLDEVFRESLHEAWGVRAAL